MSVAATNFVRGEETADSVARIPAGVSPRQSAWRRICGFTLLELMIVISIIMILMAVAVPLYQHHIVEAREAVLRQNIHTIDQVIEQYRLDKHESPQSLDDLVPTYFRELPVDPMTGKADWTTEQEDPENAVDPQQPGIARVHSASQATALNGEAYSTW
ncbi:MAG TPA: prepilin-type N-terminal cleavage/methylation domain-containing protein [Candidatus Sulfotelmatobacter sp.]|nr:prepilin-type N-terminal cleavage/methylation domain-containing protein [Candidatus Sulfotelmatobacter sp.]